MIRAWLAIAGFALGAAARAEEPATPAPDAGVPAAAEPVTAATAAEPVPEDEGFVEEMVVTAPALDLTRVAGSAASVGEQELDRFEHSDVHRVLEKVPGVYLRGEDGFGLRPNIGLRGAPADRSSKVVLMEDGVPLGPAPYSAPAAYYFPVTNRLTGVDVYKGPAAIRFGPHTVGGAVDVRTREIPKAGQLGLADAAFGLDIYGKLHAAWGYGTDGWGVLVEGVRLQTRGFKHLDGAGGDTGFEKNEVLLKARYSPGGQGDRHRLEVRLGVANERSNETYLGLTDADFQADPFRRYASSQLDQMRWLRTQVRLAYHVEPAPSLKLDVTAYRHDFSRAWTKLNRFRDGPELNQILAYPDAGQTAVFAAVLRGAEDSSGPEQALMVGTNDRRFVSQGVLAEATWILDGELSHLVRAGVRLHQDQIDRLHTEDGFMMQELRLVPDGTERLTTADSLGASRALALYAMDELLWGRWLLVPGLRAELIHNSYRDALSGRDERGLRWSLLPGLGAVYRITDQWSAVAGVHRGFSPLTPGSGAGSPEYSINYEAGARFTVAEQTRAEAMAFFSDYSNLTRDCSFAAGCREEQLQQQFEAGRVHVGGLEAAAEHRLSLPHGLELRLGGSYTLTLSRFLTAFTSDNPQFGRVEVGDELPGIPVHQAALKAVLEAGVGVSAGVSATFVGDVRERAGQGPIPAGERIPGHLVLDLSGSWKPTASGELYLVVENVLNTPYLVSRRPFGARPGRPFFAQVGYRYRW